MKKLFTFLALMLCYVGMAGAVEMGLSQTIDGTKFSANIWTGADNVTIQQEIGTRINDYKGTSKTVYLNGDPYTTTDCWRKNDKDVYTNQNVGYKLTIATGYSLDISNISARIVVADDTYNWYAEIVDANGVQLYKSEDKTTKKASTSEIAESLSLTGISGSIGVRVWVKQGGAQKYFIVDKLIITAEIKEDTRTTYTVGTSVTPEGSGTVTPAGENQFVEGSNVVLTAVANTGYKFVKWTVDGADVEGNPYTISNITSAHTAVATFEALPKISYELGEATGVVPSVEYAEVGTIYILPQAYHLVKDNCTLIGWNDGNKTYRTGESVSISGDITLTPVFVSNMTALGDAETTINWIFAPEDGAPKFKNERSTINYVQKAKIGDIDIDVPMFVNTQTGKFDNSTQTNRAQVNIGTTFVVPAIQGMDVVISFTNVNTDENRGMLTSVESVTFNNENASDIDLNSKILKYTYNGTEETLNMVFADGQLYPSGIKVTYPIEEKSLTTTDTDFYGLYLPYQASVPEGITAYTGALSNDQATLTLSKVEGVIPANTAVLVKSNAVGEYTFNVSNEETADAIANNSLQGVTVETAVADLAKDGKTVLTLGVADGIVAFRQPAAETIKANKVYLLVDAASSAKIRIVEGEATGIEEIYEFGIKNSEAATYDLSGRKVANPTKGLYIKSGKKFIVK